MALTEQKFLQAGTGATNRDVTDKLKEFVSVKDFGAVGDGVTDDTAAIAAAVAAANAIGAASGGYCRLIFPDGTYLIDSLLVKSFIWFDLGGAVLKKRADGVSAATNSLIRAVEVLDGSTYYGEYEKIKITGGYLTANGKSCPSSLVRLLYIDGLDIDGVTVLEHSPANWAFALGGRHGNIRNCTILGGDVVFEDGIHLTHGSYWRISNNYIESGDDAIAIGGEPTDPYLAADPESIRYVTVSNNTVKSEKGYALKLYVQSGATGSNWEITDVVVDGLAGKSGITRNGGIWFDDANATAAGTSQIQRVSVSNVSLDVGSTTHDETNQVGIYIRSIYDLSISDLTMKLTDKTVSTVGFLLCNLSSSENIKLDKIRCPALTRRAALVAADSNRVVISNWQIKQTSAAAVDVMSLDDMVATKIVDCDIRDVKSGSAGIVASTGTTSSLTITGNKIAHAAGATSGKSVSFASTACQYLDISGNDFSEAYDIPASASIGGTGTLKIEGNIGLSTELLKAKYFDDFYGDLLSAEWNGRVGSDPQCVTPTVTPTSTAPGIVRLTTGDDVGGTMALNGSQLESSVSFNPIFGGLVFQSKFRISAITDVCVYVGFTDQTAALEMPFTLAAGDALTSNATNAVGVLFDTAADTDNWWLVGVAADVDATKQNSAIAPVANTFETWRIEVTKAGAATFYRNGIKIGTTMSGATAANTGLVPVICAFSRSTATRNIDADYVLVECNRQ